MKKLISAFTIVFCLIAFSGCNSRFEDAKKLSIEGYNLSTYSYEYSLYYGDIPVETYKFYHYGPNSRLEVYDDSNKLDKLYIYRGESDIKYESYPKKGKSNIIENLSSNEFFKDFDKKLDPLYYEKLGLEITGNMKHREEDNYEDDKLFDWPKLKEVTDSSYQGIDCLLLVQDDSFGSDSFIKKTWLSKDTGLLLKSTTYLNSKLVSTTECKNISYEDIDESMFEIPKEE